MKRFVYYLNDSKIIGYYKDNKDSISNKYIYYPLNTGLQRIISIEQFNHLNYSFVNKSQVEISLDEKFIMKTDL